MTLVETLEDLLHLERIHAILEEIRDSLPTREWTPETPELIRD